MSKMVSKIISRTSSISSFVRNTPLKFGSLRKSSRTSSRDLNLSGSSVLPTILDTDVAMDVQPPTPRPVPDSSDFLADQRKRGSKKEKDSEKKRATTPGYD
jgi:hypothetical protein